MAKIQPDEISEKTRMFAAATLTGDVAAFLCDRLRHQEVPFRMMTEQQQETVIADAKRAASSLVARVVEIIAADGRSTIPVSVKKVENNGSEIKLTAEAPKHSELRHELFDAAGCAAFLTVADVEKYAGGEGPKADPDQPELTASDKAA